MRNYILAIFLLFAGIEFVAGQTEADFDYEQNKAGKITITKYLGKGIVDIIIPAKIQGIEVTEIGNGVFSGGATEEYGSGYSGYDRYTDMSYKISDYNPRSEKINSIVLPSSITSIGDGAFSGSGIKQINIPNGVKFIGAYAFNNNNLTEIILPNTVEIIGKSSFSFNNISNITLSNKLKQIPDSAFYNNNIMELILPDGIISIGDEYQAPGAFDRNPIVYVKLPNKLTSINESSFNGYSIKIIEYPNLISDLGWYDSAFFPNYEYGDENFGKFNCVGVKIADNARNISKVFEDAFCNYYQSQGNKAGVYIKKGKLWVTGTQAEFDKLIADKEAEIQKAREEAEAKHIAEEQEAARQKAESERIAEEERILALEKAKKDAHELELKKKAIALSSGLKLRLTTNFAVDRKNILTKKSFDEFKKIYPEYLNLQKTNTDLKKYIDDEFYVDVNRYINSMNEKQKKEFYASVN